jgi:hypothetical protein
LRIKTTATAAAACAVIGGALLAGAGGAASPNLTGVPSAQPKAAGVSSANVLSPELREHVVAQGNMPVENPSGLVTRYGYLDDGPLLPAPGDVQSDTHNVEASKTEPDKNTYLVVGGQHGADPGYDYGKHFLFQGHEGGSAGSITRINLDADAAHRVTVMATQLSDGSPLPDIDGSTWDPFTGTLFFSEEESDGGLMQATLQYPSTVTSLAGVTGHEASEGIQVDSAGNIWIVEDSGGTAGTLNPHSKQPNSFVYRLVPYNKRDLSAGGKLQVLQVISHETGQPIVFHPGQADADITSADVRDLHTYGLTFQTHWITIHDTATDGADPFDANAAAKAAGGTPFKRPENGVFRPAVGFKEFVFTETGDTTAATEAGSLGGGFGGLFDLQQSSPGADSGTLRLLYRGDIDHNSLDNITFLTKNQVIAVEDRGDGLHSDHNQLDSAWIFDVRATGPQTPVRLIAEGRDDAATIDSALSAQGNGFQNEGDNEITGIHNSDGDPTIAGLYGARKPTPFKHGWRLFWTQQHGDNQTWEIVRAQ